MQNNPSTQNPTQLAQQRSLFQILRSELSFKDIGKVMGVLFTGLGGGVLQGTAFSVIMTSGWLLSQTLIGTVVIPAFAKASLGMAQKLFPTLLAPYAAQIIIGFFACTFLFPFVSQGIKSLFAESKRNQVEGISWLDLGYYLTAWALPVALFCLNASNGVPISANLTTMGWLSGTMGAGVALITSGQEYVTQLMMRINQRMAQSVPQPMSQNADRSNATSNLNSEKSSVVKDVFEKHPDPITYNQNQQKKQKTPTTRRQSERLKKQLAPATVANTRLGNKQSRAVKKTPQSKPRKRTKR